MTKRVHLVYNDEEFIDLQEIKNQSGLSWERFVAKVILEYGENHGN